MPAGPPASQMSVKTKKKSHDDDAVIGRSTPRERRGSSSDGNGNGSPPLFLTSPRSGASLLHGSERAASSSTDTCGTSRAQRLSKDGEKEVERTSSKMRSAVRMVSINNKKLLVLVCSNIANLCCHAVYSVLASFFPEQAAAKGMSDDMVGVVFSIFAGVMFVVSPVAGILMQQRGKVWVYLCGLGIVSISTILFAAATFVPEGWPFAVWCLSIRIAQGVGAALEETAMYAIIAELDADNLTFYLGICEISTGLGYMIGPPLGGILFVAGGFSMPFVCVGALIAPAALIFYRSMPNDAHCVSKDQERVEPVAMRSLLVNPQVIVMAVAAMLANSDYAFLEPTLGEHASSLGLAKTPDAIGALFSVTIVAYTLSCPVIGLLAKRERMGPRAVIVIGLVFQLIGFLLVGPSPLLQQEQMAMPQMLLALSLFGVGAAMSMTPLMDDMMLSCRKHAEEASVTIAPLIMSSFALGQMIGPLIGSSVSGRMGFPWACTLMASLLLAHLAVIAVVSAVRPRKAMQNRAYVGVEMTSVSEPTAESAAE